MTNEEKQRFAFGENWQAFLRILSDEHIGEAEKSLRKFLGTNDLNQKRFLDIGSGSGLHSLAARKMGATVQAFDYDLQSVACTDELKRRYFPDDPNWAVQKGSILDGNFISGLGQFDVCYAWGVLHHTGALWQALYNAQLPLRQGGLLFVAIYNDQGLISTLWKIIKRFYSSGWLGRATMSLIFYPIFFLSGFILDLVHVRNPARRYREHKKYRGMSLVHDWRDWLGGYPFALTGHGFGNNQFLFQRIRTSP